MDKETILKELAPCGLDCSRCASYADGNIRKNASELLNNLGNFKVMAEKLANFNPIFKGYKEFSDILKFFSEASCAGCRQGGGKYPVCSAKDCYKEMKADFCGECSEYPCKRNKYDPSLEARWKKNNDMIKEKGVEEYYKAQKENPRY